jgi:hypothetical protein
MQYWEQKPRFEIKDDGTIVSRMGTQTNCGGIASIRARLARTSGTGITFCATQKPDWEGGKFGALVPGSAMPSSMREAVFEGAQAAYQRLGLNEGFLFELIEALVHPVDARDSKFRLAGEQAFTRWLEQQA